METKLNAPALFLSKKLQDNDFCMADCVNNRYNILTESETKCFR